MRRFTARAANPGDAWAITELLQASYPTLMRPAYDPDVLAMALRSMTSANAAFLASGTYHAAETTDGRLVGCGGWTREVPGTGEVVENIGHIRHFATHPDWTGQGIGRSLYEACEAQALQAGVTQLDCFASMNAEGFYAAIGFERIKRIEVPMPGIAFPGLLMRRMI